MMALQDTVELLIWRLDWLGTKPPQTEILDSENGSARREIEMRWDCSHALPEATY